MRVDNGGEYTSKNFKTLMIDNRIKLKYTASYSPHQKGTAE